MEDGDSFIAGNDRKVIDGDTFRQQSIDAVKATTEQKVLAIKLKDAGKNQMHSPRIYLGY